MKAKKSLGQNFLKCGWVSGAMIDVADLQKGELVLEIGPGKGALTRKLLETGAKVLAVEKDDELFKFLQGEFAEYIENGQLNVVHKDIKEFSNKDLQDLGEYKLIANIPYYITGEILRNFLSAEDKPVSATLLVQKEVVQRIVSDKESILSLSVKFYGTPKLIKKVPANCFAPAPKVDSAILHIDIYADNLNLYYEKSIFKFVKLGFKSKRKKLISNLSQEISKEESKQVFKKLEINENTRAEELDIDKWIDLVKHLG